MPPLTLTATVCTSANVVPPCTAAVTVTTVAGALSAKESSSTVRVIPVGGASSFVIVPVPVSSLIVGAKPGSPAPFAAPLSFTSNVSFGSSITSSVVLTVTVFVVSPAANGKVVAVTGVKSAAVAPPLTSAVAQVTLTTFAVAPSRVTTKLSGSPSAALASPTLKLGVSSLSVIVSVAFVMVTSVRVPVTSTVSCGSSRRSSVGVKVNVPVALAAPAASTMLKPVTAVKSVPETAVPFATRTATVCAAT